MLAFGILCSQADSITKQGEDAYGCVHGFLEEIVQDANGRAPARVELVELCGIPPALHAFSVFQSPNCGPFALALLFSPSPFNAPRNEAVPGSIPPAPQPSDIKLPIDDGGRGSAPGRSALKIEPALEEEAEGILAELALG